MYGTNYGFKFSAFLGNSYNQCGIFLIGILFIKKIVIFLRDVTEDTDKLIEKLH